VSLVTIFSKHNQFTVSGSRSASEKFVLQTLTLTLPLNLLKTSVLYRS